MEKSIENNIKSTNATIICINNSENVLNGIIYGSLFPFGLILVNERYYGGLFSYILYTIIYICVVGLIPVFVGIIILFFIISIYIIKFFDIKTKDRTREIGEIKTNIAIDDQEIKKRSLIKTEVNIPIDNKDKRANIYINNNKDIEKNIYNDNIEDEEEFECEICFKKISEEEYEAFDGMCEDCFFDVHTDFDGNFHDDEFFG